MNIFDQINQIRTRIANQGFEHARVFVYMAAFLGVFAGLAAVLGSDLASPLALLGLLGLVSAGFARLVSGLAGTSWAMFLRVVWTPPTGYKLLNETGVHYAPAARSVRPSVFSVIPAIPRRASYR